MTDSTQPEALRLADELEFVSGGWGVADQLRPCEYAAAIRASGAQGESNAD